MPKVNFEIIPKVDFEIIPKVDFEIIPTNKDDFVMFILKLDK